MKNNLDEFDVMPVREFLLLALNALGLSLSAYEKLEPYINEDCQQANNMLDAMFRSGEIDLKYYNAISKIIE